MRLKTNWLGWLTVLVFLTALLLTGLIASGRFDPPPIGQLQASLPLSSQRVTAGQQQATWLEERVPEDSYSLKLTAAHQTGEQDIGYGLLVGRAEAYLGVAVSPLGYVTIWQTEDSGQEPTEQRIMPWQIWPHIHHGGANNQIWLNVTGDEVTVRLNGEWLWQGTVTGLGKQVGLWLESFGQAATVDFQLLELFY